MFLGGSLREVFIVDGDLQLKYSSNYGGLLTDVRKCPI